MIQSKRIHITGKVQGVWYRASTKKMADQLGIVGFVANQPDGSVLIEASGSGKQLDSFIKWCQQGPPFARVDGLISEDIAPSEYSEFKIRK